MTSNISNSGNEKQPTAIRRFLFHPIICILLQLVLFVGILFVLKSVLIKPGLGLLGLSEDVFTAWQGIITLAAMFAVYIGLARFYERRRVHELSLRHLLPDGVFGVLCGTILISLIFAVLYGLGAYKILGHDPWTAMVVPGIWVVVLATMEELMFRGILYRIIEEWGGTIVALLVSAGLFGLMHITNDNADWISVLSATSGGLIMGTLYSLTGRLWIPIFFHISWNFTQAVFGSTVSGTDMFGTYFDSVREGPQWLTGGPFGVENSLVTIGLLFLVIGLLLRRMRSKGLILPRLSARGDN